MAFTINHVALVGGNLTRDAELKFSQDGKPRLNFAIAMNKGKDKPTDFFNCVFFGDMAEKIAQYMKKGTKVAIEGRLSQRRWEKDGQNHSLVEIACHNVVLLGSKQDAPAATGYGMDTTPMQAQDVPGGWDDQF